MRGGHEATVRAEVIAMHGYDGDLPFRWDMRITYATVDPFAVTFTFLTSSEHIRWGCARALLAAGLTRPAGTGDVKVRPWDGPDRWLTEITMRGPAGQVVFLAPTGVLDRFVEHTLRLVPRGAEHRHLDVDAAIAACLAGAS